MSFGDKVEAKKDQLVGNAKEKLGDLTDNESMQSEGAAQAAKGDVKEGWENTKDEVQEGVGDAVSGVKEKFDGDGR